MSEIPKLDPELKEGVCFNFTCKNKATAHDPMIDSELGVWVYVPVCSFHKRTPQKGKIGFLTLGEVKWFKRFERIIRFFGNRGG